MNRDEFLKTLGMGAAGLPLAHRLSDSYPRNPDGRSNILFITTDYQAAEDLPATGSPFLDMSNVYCLFWEHEGYRAVRADRWKLV